jgi:hypothetical protein
MATGLRPTDHDPVVARFWLPLRYYYYLPVVYYNYGTPGLGR